MTGRDSQDLLKAMKSHPYYLQYSMRNVKEVEDFLQKENFTAQQIFEGIHLILYPATLVDKKLAELALRPEVAPFSSRRKELHFLSNLLYFIEIDFEFTGTGIFANSKKIPQDKITTDTM